MTAKCDVLIVDDEPTDSLLLKRSFRKVDPEINICIAEDGQEALALLMPDGEIGSSAMIEPAFVVLDLKMRHVDGHEVLRRLSNIKGSVFVPIVVFTSSSDPFDIQRAYDLGANSYIVKPVGAEGLYDVARVMANYWCKYNKITGRASCNQKS